MYNYDILDIADNKTIVESNDKYTPEDDDFIDDIMQAMILNWNQTRMDELSVKLEKISKKCDEIRKKTDKLQSELEVGVRAANFLESISHNGN